MTVIDRVVPNARAAAEETQRFVFHDTDWAFYEQVGRKMSEQRAFVTFYKGRLEVVTVSYLHERIVGLIIQMVRILAEESNTPLIGAGMTTLKRADLDEAVEPDASFYTHHANQMREKKEIELAGDPPPDLAIEVEITRRLADRKTIYQDLGVPEIWVHGKDGLTFLVRKCDRYESMDRSPTFPQLNAKELADFVASGLVQDETTWAKVLRKRAQEAIASISRKL